MNYEEIYNLAEREFISDRGYGWGWEHLEGGNFTDVILKLVEKIIKNNPEDDSGRSVKRFLKCL